MERLRPPRRPRRWTLALYRAPISLYRLGLGGLLGGRFLLLHHVGRKTGLERHAVLEVMQHTGGPNRWVVASGWGTASDWYRNLLAQPRARVAVGRRSWPVAARPLDVAEAEQVMLDYGRAHPRSVRATARLIGYRIDGSEADLRAVARVMPLIELAEQ